MCWKIISLFLIWETIVKTFIEHTDEYWQIANKVICLDIVGTWYPKANACSIDLNLWLCLIRHMCLMCLVL